MKPFIYIGIIAGLLVFSTFSYAESMPEELSLEESSFKKIPLPVHELQILTIRWLSSLGFPFETVDLTMGKVQINAQKNQHYFKFQLEPYSPLGSKIYLMSNQTNLNQAFWENIKQYLNTGNAKQFPTPIYQKLDTVVCIYAKNNRMEKYQITGFILEPNGVIICTAHNLVKLSEIHVRFADGSEKRGNIIKINQLLDLAMIKVEAESLNSISLNQTRNMLNLGEELYAIGYPLNRNGTISHGKITELPRKTADQTFWQIDMEIYSGSSGSPVFDLHGNLVAIVKGHYRGSTSVGFLIPMQSLFCFLNDPMQNYFDNSTNEVFNKQ